MKDKGSGKVVHTVDIVHGTNVYEAEHDEM
jgi:hypothetical protein